MLHILEPSFERNCYCAHIYAHVNSTLLFSIRTEQQCAYLNIFAFDKKDCHLWLAKEQLKTKILRKESYREEAYHIKTNKEFEEHYAKRVAR